VPKIGIYESALAAVNAHLIEARKGSKLTFGIPDWYRHGSDAGADPAGMLANVEAIDGLDRRPASQHIFRYRAKVPTVGCTGPNAREGNSVGR
jgi:hypothetical protein